MKRLRGLFVGDPIIIVSTIVLGTINIAISFFDPKGNQQIRLARLWSKILLGGCGIEVQVEGLEQLDLQSSYVFVANHASYMDTPVAIAKIPMQFRFLAKRGLFKIPFLGQHLTKAGHIPVDRGDARAAVKTLSVAAEVIQQKRISLLIFPEGGRSHDGRLQGFKDGSAYIAIKAGVPIVPLVLMGTDQVLPYGSGVVLPGKVVLRVLTPIPTDRLTSKDRVRVTEEIHAQFKAHLEGDRQPEPAAV